MREKINSAVKHPLISGSAIIFFGSLVGSFINFIFNLLMTRYLSVSDYGILLSIVSLFTLATIPAGAVNPMVINFAGFYIAKNEMGKLRDLFFKILKFMSFIGFVIFAFFLIFSNSIGSFFRINSQLLIIFTGFMVFVTFVGIVNNALLQAKLLFKFMTFINFFSALAKLLFGIGLVFLGYAVGGAVFAIFMSLLIPYAISFIPLRSIFSNKVSESKIDIKHLFLYGAPAAITVFGLTSFATTDIILVKHFFDPVQAGLYAGLSTVGKVIFFFSAPIGLVMFPLIVQKHAKEEDYNHIFKFALFLVFIASIAITAFYFLFPDFTIKFFIKKSEYLSVAPILGIYGLYISIYSMLSVITNFFLSIKKTKVFVPVIFGALAQALIIWFYHQTFLQIIIISLTITSLLFFSFLLYYLKLHEETSKV